MWWQTFIYWFDDTMFLLMGGSDASNNRMENIVSEATWNWISEHKFAGILINVIFKHRRGQNADSSVKGFNYVKEIFIVLQPVIDILLINAHYDSPKYPLLFMSESIFKHYITMVHQFIISEVNGYWCWKYLFGIVEGQWIDFVLLFHLLLGCFNTNPPNNSIACTCTDRPCTECYLGWGDLESHHQWESSRNLWTGHMISFVFPQLFC